MENYRDDVVCGFIRKLLGVPPIAEPTDAARSAQKLFEKEFGITGIERREEMVELLEECWYALAKPHPDMGWYTNGDKLLVKLEKLLGGRCGRDVHVNHCCVLGLVYQKNKIIAGEARGPVPEEAMEREKKRAKFP